MRGDQEKQNLVALERAQLQQWEQEQALASMAMGQLRATLGTPETSAHEAPTGNSATGPPFEGEMAASATGYRCFTMHLCSKQFKRALAVKP